MENIFNEDLIILKYKNLKLNCNGYKFKTDYEFYIEKDRIIESIYSYACEEDNLTEIDNFTDDEILDWVIENFDDLFDKYYPSLLTEYRSEAKEAAEENYDEEEYLED